MTRPTNEPHWCRRGDHDQFPRLHKSGEVRVGPRPRYTGNGEAFAWLQQADGEPEWLGIGVAHMASVTVELSPADAVAFRDALTWLIRAAGWEEAAEADK